jgi:hypothetical protein
MTAGNYRGSSAEARSVEVRLVEVRFIEVKSAGVRSHDKSLTSGYTRKVVSKDPNSGGFGGRFASLV